MTKYLSQAPIITRVNISESKCIMRVSLSRALLVDVPPGGGFDKLHEQANIGRRICRLSIRDSFFTYMVSFRKASI